MAISVPEIVENSKYFVLKLSNLALIIGPLIRSELGPKSSPNFWLSGSIGPARTFVGLVHCGLSHSKMFTCANENAHSDGFANQIKISQFIPSLRKFCAKGERCSRVDLRQQNIVRHNDFDMAIVARISGCVGTVIYYWIHRIPTASVCFDDEIWIQWKCNANLSWNSVTPPLHVFEKARKNQSGHV